MPEILITDLHNVIIDGVNSDDLFAAIRNNPELREQLELAALNWSFGSSNAYRSVDEFSAKLVALKAEHESAIAAAETTAKRTAQAIAAAKLLLNEQDPDKLRAGVAQIVAFAEAPETARQLAEAEAEAKAAQARVEALKAAL